MIQAPVQVESAEDIGASADASLVAQFLARTDVSCTNCGYNLRGCRQQACPECGEEIRLALRSASNRSLQNALRYLVTAMLFQVSVSFLWTIWIMLRYITLSASGTLSATYIVRWGVQAVADLGIGIVCAVLLVKLRAAAAGHGKHETIARLCLTLGILVAIMMVLVVGMGIAS